MIGLMPLYACLVLEDTVLEQLPAFKKRFDWWVACACVESNRLASAVTLCLYHQHLLRPWLNVGRFLKHRKDLPDQVQRQTTADGCALKTSTNEALSR